MSGRAVRVVTIAAAIGIATGVAAALLAAHGSATGVAPTAPNEVWREGALRAAAFRLADQANRPLSLHSLRGRVVILSFVDPACHSLCPLEAKELASVARDLGPQRAPDLVAVSVNPRGDTRANFRKDARAWRLPATWRWAVGTATALARVWRDYRIAVQIQPLTHEVAHTEAAYVIDANGYQRALYVYPFHAGDVEREIRTLVHRS